MSSPKPPKQLNAWIKHVKKVQKEKGISYKEALVVAKKSYKSKLSPGSKATKKRLAEGKRLKKAHCKSPNLLMATKTGFKCYKPCSPSKKGSPRMRSTKSHRCKVITKEEMKKFSGKLKRAATRAKEMGF